MGGVFTIVLLPLLLPVTLFFDLLDLLGLGSLFDKGMFGLYQLSVNGLSAVENLLRLIVPSLFS